MQQYLYDLSVLQEAEQRRISEAKQRQHSLERIENLNNNMNSSSSNNNLPGMRGYQVIVVNSVKWSWGR